MRVLGNPIHGDARVISGESGAVTTGLVYELLKNPRFNGLREDLNLKRDSKVLVISTEGDTDAAYYRKIVW
jgi:diaminopropionate ammonia-lyase